MPPPGGKSACERAHVASTQAAGIADRASTSRTHTAPFFRTRRVASLRNANACRCRWVALGANTGSVYIFQRGPGRTPLQYRQMVANNDGDVSAMAFAPNDNLLAVGTAKGAVLVLELNLDGSKEKTKVWRQRRSTHVRSAAKTGRFDARIRRLQRRPRSGTWITRSGPSPPWTGRRLRSAWRPATTSASCLWCPWATRSVGMPCPHGPCDGCVGEKKGTGERGGGGSPTIHA